MYNGHQFLYNYGIAMKQRKFVNLKLSVVTVSHLRTLRMRQHDVHTAMDAARMIIGCL
jgi:hypothetical protein